MKNPPADTYEENVLMKFMLKIRKTEKKSSAYIEVFFT